MHPPLALPPPLDLTTLPPPDSAPAPAQGFTIIGLLSCLGRTELLRTVLESLGRFKGAEDARPRGVTGAADTLRWAAAAAAVAGACVCSRSQARFCGGAAACRRRAAGCAASGCGRSSLQFPYGLQTWGWRGCSSARAPGGQAPAHLRARRRPPPRYVITTPSGHLRPTGKIFMVTHTEKPSVPNQPVKKVNRVFEWPAGQDPAVAWRQRPGLVGRATAAECAVANRHPAVLELLVQVSAARRRTSGPAVTHWLRAAAPKRVRLVVGRLLRLAPGREASWVTIPATSGTMRRGAGQFANCLRLGPHPLLPPGPRPSPDAPQYGTAKSDVLDMVLALNQGPMLAKAVLHANTEGGARCKATSDQ